ncbi:MAG TPA: hypothetical protein P5560_13230 [Thermotogota bacterium]|nr:hypothetical protein [Thermotogota bacterium]HRW93909.1 hypothetical protein [Thermotogota bacterium]
MRKDLFTSVYPKDNRTGGYVVDVSLDGYGDLFNAWDRAPLKRRDLNPDLNNFMEEATEEIPMKFPIVVLLHLPRGSRIGWKEEKSRTGWKNYYRFQKHLVSKEIRESNGRIVVYVIVAMLFLFLAYFFQPWEARGLVYTITIQGMVVGGWVFLWEAFSMAFFKNRTLYRHRRRYHRLMETEIRFVYDE